MARRRTRRAEATNAAPPAPRRRRAALVFIILGLIALAIWGSQRRNPASAPHSQPTPAARLNVLLITVDTTRADYLGCYGRADARTPNMDRLARAGTLFTRCTCCTPQTLPSHASIMTGLYPFVHGVRRNSTQQLPESATTLAEALRDAGFATRAAIAAFVLNERFGTGQGFDVYHDVPQPRGLDPRESQRKGNVVCDDALRLLRDVAGQRFFLWVHFFDPHYPYESDRFPDPESPAAYADEVAFMDLQIGRLLDELRARHLEEQTLVVVVGDHGEGLGDHDEMGHGYLLYDTTLHVPLIMACPGVLPGNRVVTAQVRTVDVAPTILELTHVPPLPEAQGISLAPLLLGQAEDLTLQAYSEATEAWTLFGLSRLRSLSSAGWKYIHSPSSRLFDLRADPGESRDLLTDEPTRSAQYRAALRSILAAAPPPLVGASAPLTLTGEELAQLASLGYVGSASPSEAANASELDTFEPIGGDPQAHSFALSEYQRAREEIFRNEFARAEERLRAVVAELPDAPEILSDLAFSLTRQQKYPEAMQLYERVLALRPTDARKRMELAALLMSMNRVQDAITQARLALEHSPDDFGAHSMLGVVLGRLGQSDESLSHLEAAHRINPRHFGAVFALGNAYRQQGRLNEAATCFRQALVLDPNSAAARTALHEIEQLRSSGAPPR